MKKVFSWILHIISRVIYKLIPKEYRREYRLRKHFSTYDMYKEEQRLKSYNHFKKYFKNAILWPAHKHPGGVYDPLNNKNSIREYAIKLALEKDPGGNKYSYLEFGVYKGNTINFFSAFVSKIYGFDSFEGLKDEWLGTTGPKGLFNLNKKIPPLKKNVIPIKGWVQDTLDDFLNKNKPKVNFLHMDLDTYESSKFVLNKIKPYLIKDAVILFDELYNYAGWDVNEYKALQETFDESEYKYRAFEGVGCQVVIQIVNKK